MLSILQMILKFQYQVMFNFITLTEVYSIHCISITGSAGIVVVLSSQLDRITPTDSSRPVVLKFVSADNRVLNATELIFCSGFLIGEITIPNESFHYVLEGYDRDNNKFSQISLTTPFTFPDPVTPSPTSVVPTITRSVVTRSVFVSSTRTPIRSSRLFTTSSTRVPTTSSISTSTVVVTSSPTVPPTPDCPCLNGGRCVTVTRFGRKRVFCRCSKGFTGSLCQFSK